MPAVHDFANFAYSFSHAIILAGGRQFTGIDAVNVNQSITETAVYGTDRKPLKRSTGQLSLGRGRLSFSDFGDAADFFESLQPEPLMSIWSLDYILSREDGSTRSVECVSCRLTGFNMDHKAGAGAVGLVFPFSFLDMKVDGINLLMSPKALVLLGLKIAGNVASRVL